MAASARRSRHLRPRAGVARSHARGSHVRASKGGSARTVAVVVLSTLMTFSIVGLAASTAYADPTPDEIEAQIDRAWRELAPVIEQHNATRAELEQKREGADELAERITPLQMKVDIAMAEISDMAVHAFKSGNASTFNVLLSSGSPYTFAEQLTVLDQVSRAQQQQLAKVIESKQEYETEKAVLDELVRELEEAEAELGRKAEQIDAEIDRLQALRIQAYGESGGTGSLRPAACPAEYPGGPGSVAASFACEQIGKPYQWGSTGPGSYDCSGLTLTAWRQAGVHLPHNAAQQRNVIRYVDRDQLQVGDLVFYYGNLSHVGIYVGDGWIVDAPRTGMPVQMRGMDAAGPIHSFGRPG